MPRSKTKTAVGYETPFAARLRELIETAEIPQSALAEYIGVTRQAVSAYSLGTSVPDIEKFEMIANYFDVSTEYLLGRTDIKKADASKQAAAECLGLSEEAVDAICGLKGIHFEQSPENDYKVTKKPTEPLPEVFSKWLSMTDLSLLMSNLWQMLCGAVSAQDSGWNKEAYVLNDAQKTAITDLKQRGYVTLSMTQQVSFFSQSAIETFTRSVDGMINDAIEIVDEENVSRNNRQD